MGCLNSFLWLTLTLIKTLLLTLSLIFVVSVIVSQISIATSYFSSTEGEDYSLMSVRSDLGRTWSTQYKEVQVEP